MDDDSFKEEVTTYNKHYDKSTKVTCIMLATMSFKLQNSFESLGAFSINKHLKDMFQE